MSGDHSGYIWAAYGATALAVAGLLIRAVLDHRVQSRKLARLQGASEGARRTDG